MSRTGLLILLCVVGCTKEVGGTVTSPTPETPVVSLAFVGPYSIAEDTCTEFALALLDKAGDERPQPMSVAADLAGGSFFSDAACATAATTATIQANTASSQLWLQIDTPGRVDLTASDVAAGSPIGPASLTVSVDALLLAAQSFSSYEGVFNNGAWATVETAVGVPMQVSVTVPESGSWYIEVRARSGAREANGSQMAVRLLQDGATVDFDVINATDNEYHASGLVYVENNPTPGATYTYSMQWTASGGGNHFYNFQQYTIGPAGDQILGGASQITAIVRPARYPVD